MRVSWGDRTSDVLSLEEQSCGAGRVDSNDY